jgi:hypothetical protein
MFNESLIVGLVVLLMCGAVCFYMYVRLMFLEKKVTIMESILVDVKVALDSISMENLVQPAPVPITHTPGPQLSAPVPLEASESEDVPEEKFYSSVLEQAHDAQQVGGGVSADAALATFSDVSANAVDVSGALSALEEPKVPAVNLDAMTRNELAAYAEKNGIRVKRSQNRGEVLALVRRLVTPQNAQPSAGADTENVSGSNGGTFEAGASLDGNVPMDTDKNGSPLEVGI